MKKEEKNKSKYSKNVWKKSLEFWKESKTWNIIKDEKCFPKRKKPSIWKKHKNTSSKFFGVFLYNQKQTIKGKKYIKKYWVANIRVDRKKYTLGYFKDEISAAKEYDKFVKLNNLKNPLNFIEKELDNLKI